MKQRKDRDGIKALFTKMAPLGFRKKLEQNRYVFEMCQEMATDSLRGLVCWALYNFWLEDKLDVTSRDIVDATDISYSEVSNILSYLEENKVITRQKKGKFILNRLSDRSVNFLQIIVADAPVIPRRAPKPA